MKEISLGGAVSVGGLYACSLSGIAGILTGNVLNTARDDAVPFVSSTAIANWATEQAKLVPLLYREHKELMDCAQIIRLLGGDTGDLPIGYYQGRSVSYSDIANDKDLPNEIYLIWGLHLERFSQIEGFKPVPNMISGDYIGYPVILQNRSRFFRFSEWPVTIKYEHLSKNANRFINNLLGAVIEAIFQAWGIELKNLTSDYIEELDQRETNVIVGHIGETPVLESVFIIKKPDDY